MTPSELYTVVAKLADKSPTMPASFALGVKQYDELCRRILCTPVTPLVVVQGRLLELTEASHSD